VQAPYDTQGLNRYAYVRNNPLRYTDPSGFCFNGHPAGDRQAYQCMETILVQSFGLTEWQLSRLTNLAEQSELFANMLQAAAIVGSTGGQGEIEQIVVEQGRLPAPQPVAVDVTFYAPPFSWNDLAGVDLGLRTVDVLALLLSSGFALLEPTPIGEAAVVSSLAGYLGRRAVTSAAYSPLNPGPLSTGVASTFRGASYREVTYDQATRLYRVYGGKSGQLGSFWTATAPTGALRSRIDLALNPQWGNSATQVVRIDVPSGVTMYEGYAASQGALVGGGSQVFIPHVNPAWIVR
jgi:hypothetical protein